MPETKKFVITDYKFPTIEIEKKIIEEAGGELAACQCKTEAEVIQAGRDAGVLLVQFAPVTAAVIDELRRCKAIVRYGIGVDNVDLEAARRRGMIVCNVPGYCIDEVADHAFALALALSRQLSVVDERLRSGLWENTPPKPMPASRQMTFATIGYGRIARAVLDRARACKFSLATCDPYLPSGTPLPEDLRLLEMEQALGTADILSLHLPLTEKTRHLIDTESLLKMKSTALVINTSRGGLIDTVALAAALQEGRIAGAGLDVFEREPLEADHPLRKCPNALLTPHLAWYSEMSSPELQKQTAEEAVRVMNGHAPYSRLV